MFDWLAKANGFEKPLVPSVKSAATLAQTNKKRETPHMLTTLFAAILATSAANADTLNSVDVIKQLPQLSSTSVVVDNGPAIAAVQPTAFLKFSYVSCARFDFDVETDVEDGVLFVAVKINPNQFDCLAVGVARKYEVQISSDYAGESVVVLNPVVAATKTRRAPAPQPPRMCTMNAGILYNPATGKCQGFTNGCQEAELRNKGFVYPQDNQCRP
jgi:hypothetical protein